MSTLAASLGATIVGIKRRELFNIKSMLKGRQHARTEAEARAKIRRAHEIIDHYADVVVQYGQFVTDPAYRASLFADFGLPAPEMEFYDANRQYG